MNVDQGLVYTGLLGGITEITITLSYFSTELDSDLFTERIISVLKRLRDPQSELNYETKSVRRE